jgi:hypothetical protein
VPPSKPSLENKALRPHGAPKGSCRRARLKAKAKLARQVADFDAGLLALRDEFHQLALEHHRQCYAAAIDEAVTERAAHPDALLN